MGVLKIFGVYFTLFAILVLFCHAQKDKVSRSGRSRNALASIAGIQRRWPKTLVQQGNGKFTYGKTYNTRVKRSVDGLFSEDTNSARLHHVTRRKRQTSQHKWDFHPSSLLRRRMSTKRENVVGSQPGVRAAVKTTTETRHVTRTPQISHVPEIRGNRLLMDKQVLTVGDMINSQSADVNVHLPVSQAHYKAMLLQGPEPLHHGMLGDSGTVSRTEHGSNITPTATFATNSMTRTSRRNLAPKPSFVGETLNYAPSQQPPMHNNFGTNSTRQRVSVGPSQPYNAMSAQLLLGNSVLDQMEKIMGKPRLDMLKKSSSSQKNRQSSNTKAPHSAPHQIQQAPRRTKQAPRRTKQAAPRTRQSKHGTSAVNMNEINQLIGQASQLIEKFDSTLKQKRHRSKPKQMGNQPPTSINKARSQQVPRQPPTTNNQSPIPTKIQNQGKPTPARSQQHRKQKPNRNPPYTVPNHTTSSKLSLLAQIRDQINRKESIKLPTNQPLTQPTRPPMQPAGPPVNQPSLQPTRPLMQPTRPLMKPTRPPMQPTGPPMQPTRPPMQPTRPPMQPIRPHMQPTRPPIQPTRPPIQPTRPPMQPTRPPMQPTRPPLQQTRHPMRPTRPPMQPTRPHMQPTRPLMQPTRPPMQPTRPPMQQTRPPMRPTRPPMQPTRPHMQPTRPPMQPTRPPMQPTRPPMQPTRPPIQPTRPPMQPTIPHMKPAGPPMQPMRPPMQPTRPPMQPKRPPMQPTRPPMQPTRPPMQPTRPPMQPTRPPMQPTRPPMQPKIPSVQQSRLQPTRPPMQPTRPHMQPTRPPMQPTRHLMQPTRPPMQPTRPPMQPTRPPMQPKRPSVQQSRLQPTRPPMQPTIPHMQPTRPPMQPTRPPMQPTRPPMQPTRPPMQPKRPSVQQSRLQPTRQPMQPTRPHMQPTRPPMQPTRPPMRPTRPPMQQTRPPMRPTRPPMQPTRPHMQPTRPPMQPTRPPMRPTRHPMQPTRHHMQPTRPPMQPTRPPMQSKRPSVQQSRLQPTRPPMQPTRPPMQPTRPPMQPTRPHMQPTRPPMQPTRPPMQPTRPHMQPTRPPMQPTRPPMQPTRPPMQSKRPSVQQSRLQPTRPPMQPTRPPMQPTRPPMQPTRPHMQPTRPPMQPTRPPMQQTRPLMKPTRPPMQPTRPPMQPTRPLMQSTRPQMQPTKPIMQPKRHQMQPTGPPMQPTRPTRPPMQPTRPPMQPTRPPMQPTMPPLQPTRPPMQPTRPPMQPTRPLMQPTRPPMQPTRLPMQPTRPPMQPTRPPMQPTRPLLQTTIPPMQPTRHPMQPTRPPVQQPRIPPTEPPFNQPRLQSKTPRPLSHIERMLETVRNLGLAFDPPKQHVAPRSKPPSKPLEFQTVQQSSNLNPPPAYNVLHAQQTTPSASQIGRGKAYTHVPSMVQGMPELPKLFPPPASVFAGTVTESLPSLPPKQPRRPKQQNRGITVPWHSLPPKQSRRPKQQNPGVTEPWSSLPPKQSRRPKQQNPGVTEPWPSLPPKQQRRPKQPNPSVTKLWPLVPQKQPRRSNRRRNGRNTPVPVFLEMPSTTLSPHGFPRITTTIVVPVHKSNAIRRVSQRPSPNGVHVPNRVPGVKVRPIYRRRRPKPRNGQPAKQQAIPLHLSPSTIFPMPTKQKESVIPQTLRPNFVQEQSNAVANTAVKNPLAPINVWQAATVSTVDKLLPDVYKVQPMNPVSRDAHRPPSTAKRTVNGGNYVKNWFLPRHFKPDNHNTGSKQSTGNSQTTGRNRSTGNVQSAIQSTGSKQFTGNRQSVASNTQTTVAPMQPPVITRTNNGRRSGKRVRVKVSKRVKNGHRRANRQQQVPVIQQINKKRPVALLNNSGTAAPPTVIHSEVPVKRTRPLRRNMGHASNRHLAGSGRRVTSGRRRIIKKYNSTLPPNIIPTVKPLPVVTEGTLLPKDNGSQFVDHIKQILNHIRGEHAATHAHTNHVHAVNTTARITTGVHRNHVVPHVTPTPIVSSFTQTTRPQVNVGASWNVSVDNKATNVSQLNQTTQTNKTRNRTISITRKEVKKPIDQVHPGAHHPPINFNVFLEWPMPTHPPAQHQHVHSPSQTDTFRLLEALKTLQGHMGSMSHTTKPPVNIILQVENDKKAGKLACRCFPKSDGCPHELKEEPLMDMCDVKTEIPCCDDN